MFTGIIEEIGTVRDLSGGLTIEARKVVEDMKAGDSVAINGVCLTVIAVNRSSFRVELMPETVRRTNLGKLRYRDKVNLERAVPATGRFGGHFVQGHVDGVGVVSSVWREGQAVIMKFSVSEPLMPYIVDKGFVAVDGVSLTVISPQGNNFLVSLVGYTLDHTILGQRRPGDVVNIEVDVLAKYIESLMRADSRTVTVEFLERHGFVKAR